jgi:molybdopterin molybdotransferase
MRDHSHHIQLTREEAVAAMLGRLDFPRRTELLPLDQADGRVLCEELRALVDLPPVLTCAMDSIAVHWSDFEGLPAGQLPDTSAWVKGRDWIFANTGIAMPEGFDTAIVIEHVQVSADAQSVSIDAAPSRRFAGTRAVGSELAQGDLLAPAWTLLTPDYLASLARGGIRQVEVQARPKVAFIPTGNELVPVAANPLPSQNVESNSVLVAAKLRRWGGQPVVFPIIPDIPARIEQAVLTACKYCDIVVLNAGSSKGSDDWSIEQLDTLGEVLCHETTHGPGHHSSYALVEGKPVVGISGPPAGCAATTDFYLRPLLRAWYRQPPLPKLRVRLAAEFPSHGAHAAVSEAPNMGSATAATTPAATAGEVRPSVAPKEGGKPFYNITYLRLEQDGQGVFQAYPVGGKPGAFKSLAADALFMKPSGAGAPAFKVGDLIEVEPLHA